MIARAVAQLRVVVLAMVVAAGNPHDLYRVDRAGIGSCYDADLSLMLSAHAFAYLEPGALEVSFPQPPLGFRARERVALLGDLTSSFSARASRYLVDTVVGKNVFLAFDSEMRDSSGSLVAYVYLPDDGSCVNLTLIRSGLARVVPDANFQFRSEFEMYEQKAKEKRLGIWRESSSSLGGDALPAAPGGLCAVINE